jgi:uncharacterized membrane protein
MPEQVLRGLEILAQIMEIIGSSALVLGFVIATVRYLRQIGDLGGSPALGLYRQSLGRVVLIGLEILVAATIIKTITVDPSPEALGMLVAMIGIRTILSWTMVLEMTGRWPWQKAPA